MSFTDKTVNFLRGWQRFIRAVESLAIDIISLVIPWVSPLIPAYMAWESMTTRLAFPAWVALAGALVVELLGLATINTVFEFWNYNQDKLKTQGKAPVLVALLVTAFYLAVILTVNTMLDDSPAIYRVAKGLLSSLTICGGVTIALRANHARRIEAAEQDRAERKAERAELRQAKAERGQLVIRPAASLSPLVFQPSKNNGHGNIKEFTELMQ